MLVQKQLVLQLVTHLVLQLKGLKLSPINEEQEEFGFERLTGTCPRI